MFICGDKELENFHVTFSHTYIMLGAAEYIRRFNARGNVNIINSACLVSLSTSSGSHCVASFNSLFIVKSLLFY